LTSAASRLLAADNGEDPGKECVSCGPFPWTLSLTAALAFESVSLAPTRLSVRVCPTIIHRDKPKTISKGNKNDNRSQFPYCVFQFSLRIFHCEYPSGDAVFL